MSDKPPRWDYSKTKFAYRLLGEESRGQPCAPLVFKTAVAILAGEHKESLTIEELQKLLEDLKDLQGTVNHRMLDWFLNLQTHSAPRNFIDDLSLRRDDSIPEFWPRLPEVIKGMKKPREVALNTNERFLNEINDAVEWANGLHWYLVELVINLSTLIKETVAYKAKPKKKAKAKKRAKKKRA